MATLSLFFFLILKSFFWLCWVFIVLWASLGVALGLSGILRVAYCSLISQTDWDARQSILFTWNESYLSNVEGTERIEAWKPEQETSTQICLH